jgi:hypothetical protein
VQSRWAATALLNRIAEVGCRLAALAVAEGAERESSTTTRGLCEASTPLSKIQK